MAWGDIVARGRSFAKRVPVGLGSVVVAEEQRRLVIAHYNEITLKLGNRGAFTARLLDNMRQALAPLPSGAVRSQDGRVTVVPGSADPEEICRRLAQVPGIANLSVATVCEPDMDSLLAEVERMTDGWQPAGSFRVRVRRAWKGFALESPEIGARVGAVLADRTGAPVNLGRPDEVVYVHVVRDAIYLSLGRVQGCGGLPVGTGGRALLLLSGGIDSPVAGLRMMRRGCRVDAVHFHSVPYLDRSSMRKARRLAAVLARGQSATRLHMVAFGEAQSEVVRLVPRPLRVLMYRRLMVKIACRLANQGKAAALISGESLGQVASQTMANLAVIEQAAELPLYRPLLGMDKLEITDYAREADTYDISIEPDQDCCTLFVPRHPATRAALEDVLRAEASLDVEALIDAAVEASEYEYLKSDWEQQAAGLPEAAGREPVEAGA